MGGYFGMKRCAHETTVRGGTPERVLCADCGVLLSMTDPVIAAIVDSAPMDITMQQRLAMTIGSVHVHAHVNGVCACGLDRRVSVREAFAAIFDKLAERR